MTVLPVPKVFSDPSHDFLGRTKTAHPTITVQGGNGKLHMEMAGANPLIPLAPDIDTKLDISMQITGEQACYTGHLFGDAFPNAEVFVVNSRNTAKMLLTFTTKGTRNVGPVELLPGNNNRDMGSFSNVCSEK